MKPTFIIGSAVWVFSLLTTHAVTYISDFTTLAEGQSLDGFDGWSQNEPNYNDGDEDYPRAFGHAGLDFLQGGVRPAAALGGFYDGFPTGVPGANGKFYASRTLSLGQTMIFNMNFALFDSLDFQPERNSFQVGFYDEGSEIFSLVFDPNVDSEEPNALINSNDTWNVSASSGGIKTSASMAVLESQVYGLTISLTPSGSDLDYAFTLTSGNAVSTSGTFSNLDNYAINELRIGIDPTIGNDPTLGSNLLVFEGIVAAIPEPSSLFLFALAAGGIAIRRRRN